MSSNKKNYFIIQYNNGISISLYFVSPNYITYILKIFDCGNKIFRINTGLCYKSTRQSNVLQEKQNMCNYCLCDYKSFCTFAFQKNNVKESNILLIVYYTTAQRICVEEIIHSITFLLLFWFIPYLAEGPSLLSLRLSMSP